MRPPWCPNWSKVAPTAPQDAYVEPQWCQNHPHGSQNGARDRPKLHPRAQSGATRAQKERRTPPKRAQRPHKAPNQAKISGITSRSTKSRSTKSRNTRSGGGSPKGRSIKSAAPACRLLRVRCFLASPPPLADFRLSTDRLSTEIGT